MNERKKIRIKSLFKGERNDEIIHIRVWERSETFKKKKNIKKKVFIVNFRDTQISKWNFLGLKRGEECKKMKNFKVILNNIKFIFFYSFCPLWLLIFCI